MATPRDQQLIQAQDILSMINAENINTSAKSGETSIELIRQLLLCRVEMRDPIIAPRLTICAATTLVGVGLCQEMTNRFVLEYCLKYKRQDISFIFLTNPDLGYRDVDHMFIQLGAINAPDNLIIGREQTIKTRDLEKNNQLLTEFFKKNAEQILVDPLLNCVGTVKKNMQPLHDYCNQHNITHVCSVRSFHHTPGFVDNIETIKLNAIKLAEELKQTLSMPAKKASVYQTSHTTFAQINIEALLKKYKLPDNSQISIEKGLRNAAVNDAHDDLLVFIKHVKNINAQDSNPKIQRSALHWAAFKKHQRCYDLLISNGARQDILDADKKTPADYLTQPFARPGNDSSVKS